MNFIDCALLTLFNAALCIALPKLLSASLTAKLKRDREASLEEIHTSQTKLTAQTVTVKLPSFP